MGALAQALRTAGSHEDPDARKRADQRAAAWVDVLRGMASGDLRIGSRVPARALPVWVSLQVLRGGFATGRPAAGGPLLPFELAWADRYELPHSRPALFGFFLTDTGQAELQRLLTERTYRVELPEEAVLLTIAWLLRAGHRPAALELLDVVTPFAGQLRFAPREAQVSSLPADYLFVRTASRVRAQLAARPTSVAVETQRETLAVWNPLADAFLDLWWRTRSPTGALGLTFTNEWLEAARELIADYDRLAAVHRLATRHRNPKENLAILVAATRAKLDGHPDARLDGRARVAVAGMVTKRGEPGSETLDALRATQAAVAVAPSHPDIARVVADRLAEATPDEGLPDPTMYGGPVTAGEDHDVPAGQPMPQFVHATLKQALAAPIDQLVATGLVPSAEFLATLVPAITAATVADAYTDPDLGVLMAATYTAFRRRRSLLLVNLHHQVQLTELPWVQATAPFGDGSRPDDSLAVARRIGALTMGTFPGTILPNRLVRELDQLFTAAGQPHALVEEVAADIFQGRFSDKFLRAARRAGSLLAGSLYARYYDLDYSQLDALGVDTRRRLRLPWSKPNVPGLTFAQLCAQRAGRAGGRWSVARNGKIIEQSQLYTTHNLAMLVQSGVRPRHSWIELATSAYHRAEALISLSSTQSRPLPTIKDAAYAWRHAIFYLELAGNDAVDTFVRDARSALPAAESTRHTLELLLGGLQDIHDGYVFDADGHSPHGRRFLGWTTTPHWILDHATTLADPESATWQSG